LQQTPDIPENSQWAIFLRNHDELTLEMVTSKERDYMYRMLRGRRPRAASISDPAPARAADGELTSRPYQKLMNTCSARCPGPRSSI